MSLRPEPIGEVPEQTVRVAKASFPKGNLYLQIRDVFGPLYDDASFALLFAPQGRPAESPWRLALVTVMQFKEGLSDRQAADAVRGRIDWKYALGLELSDPGFDHSVLPEFRARLIKGSAELQLLDRLLAGCTARGYLRLRGRQRTDSTHVLAVLRALSRLELVAESLRSALNAVASAAPEWLSAHADPRWFERYSRRVEEYRLPQGQEARQTLASAIGQDGQRLLGDLDASDAPPELGRLAEVVVLREVWTQQYTLQHTLKPEQGAQGEGGGEGRETGQGTGTGTGEGIGEGIGEGGGGQDTGQSEGAAGEGAGGQGQVALRAPEAQGSASERIQSPYEPEARYSIKRSMWWIGYKSHLTESCDQDRPNLITDVATTSATVPDILMLSPIQQRLSERALLPSEHLVDAGYVGATALLESKQKHGITLVGPTLANQSWQAKAGEGFSADRFQVDWDAKTAICPMGKPSSQWCPIETATGVPKIHVAFRKTDCDACSVRERCTKARNRPRSLTLHVEPEQRALEAARRRQPTEDFRTLYKLRSGIEGTVSQGVRAYGLREARYRGLAKTHLQHVATACAINLGRVCDWLNDVPKAKTRRSRFAALANATASVA